MSVDEQIRPHITKAIGDASSSKPLVYNVFGLGEEADLTAQKMIEAQMFNTPQQLHSSTSAAFLPNPCYRIAAVNYHRI